MQYKKKKSKEEGGGGTGRFPQCNYVLPSINKPPLPSPKPFWYLPVLGHSLKRLNAFRKVFGILSTIYSRYLWED